MAEQTEATPRWKHVFGPVASRRLGRSLGIDPIPFKTCNWNCVYCQLGRTSPVVHERRAWVDAAVVVGEVREALGAADLGPIDVVTFVGSGETSLHAELGWMIRQVKALTPLPVAVITNGSTLYLPEVRDELSAADSVLTTLDAGSDALYQAIDRPHPEATFARQLEGLVAFRESYAGRLLVEVMLVSGHNDTDEALGDIARELRRIRPDQVHLSAPVRPPCETWVRPPTEERMARAREILGDVAEVLGGEPAVLPTPSRDRALADLAGAAQRHPMKLRDLGQLVSGMTDEELAQAVEHLVDSGAAKVVERGGERFLVGPDARFPSAERSEHTDPHRRRGARR
jgi:wyosine [tRNA(Phe)-imidazoG37] synthetase (radical SAM superfamily)